MYLFKILVFHGYVSLPDVMGLNWCFVFSHQHWGCNIYTLIIDEGKSASHPIENPSFQYMYHFLNEYLCLKYVQEKQD